MGSAGGGIKDVEVSSIKISAQIPGSVSKMAEAASPEEPTFFTAVVHAGMKILFIEK